VIGAFAAAAAFLLAAGIGLAVAFKGEEPVKHTAAELPTLPLPEAIAAPKVAPAAPLASSAEEPATQSTSAAIGKRGKAGNGRAPNTVPLSTLTPPPAPNPPPKAADPCGCKGNFNCILACTVKNGK